MQLLINNERTISEIRREFNDMFPYLKLEFFSRFHDAGKPSRLKFKIPAEKKLGEIRQSGNDGNMTIEPGMTVNALEQTLRNTFGLSAQVFRKSGGIWLETILTDTWTLAEQNRQGEFLGEDIEPEKPENPLDRN